MVIMLKSTPAQIRERLGYNMTRVGALIGLYDYLNNIPDAKYRNDLLRSAVVLIQATVEDVLRGLLKWHKMKSVGKAKTLAEIHFLIEGELKGNITVDQLSQCCAIDRETGESITLEEFIRQTIRTHYDQKSYGNKEPIIHAIKTLGLTPSDFASMVTSLEPMMQRRHHIVHQGDRESIGEKYGSLKAITKAEVVAWSTTSNKFLNHLITSVTDLSKPKPTAKGSKLSKILNKANAAKKK